jgi:hypothetical protein
MPLLSPAQSIKQARLRARPPDHHTLKNAKVEDMDFNFRLLRSDGAALATPRVRAEHRQWRTRQELPPLLAGYMAGWCGFAMKTLKTTSVVDGLWLWSAALIDLLRTMVATVRRRSRLHLMLVRRKLPAVASGTWRGLRRSW